ncbi:ABC transporter substrate-binding protein (plasmid) [Deinococcus psychrotolerans]|uniref:ABC transporter substrate-binding protein n=1 Tax=Deinococcus psychrotolerans TaxID=2489213 RepID=A0A3G8YTA9_9DEIO|nr:ABC transporter substrate-binding protein [Deinococcus psychrotolerans]AZI44931.1 ABC transporter substrate-binding protein [Deinococcus psychrotolerans]
MVYRTAALSLSLALLPSFALAATPKDTLVIQQAAGISTLDPSATYDTFSSQIVENIYETLWTYKGGSLTAMTPLLASSLPTFTNGGKTLVVSLRSGVKFQSGNAMSCADAEYTYRRDLVTNAPESANWFISDALLGSTKNAQDNKSITWAKIAAAVKCNAQNQLVFTLAKVDPAFMAKMTFSGMGVIDKQWAIKQGEWDGSEKTWQAWVGKDLSGSPLSVKPSGTGAYSLVKSDASGVFLQAFPGYWGAKPAIKNVVMQKVGELAVRQQAFLNGDADLIEAGTRANVEAQLKGRPGVVVLDNLPTTSAQALFMNNNIKPSAALGSGKLDGKGIPANFFSDADVRRAFALSFDDSRFIKDVQSGKGSPRTMLLPDTFPGYSAQTKTYPFDPVAAKASFQKAWGGEVWKNGFVINAKYRTGHTLGQTALELLKQNVEAINPKFRINIGVEPWSEQSVKFQNGEEVMLPMGWGADYADPDNFMYTFYSSKGYFYVSNNWKDAQVDQWLDQARATTDAAQRNKLYKQVADRAYQQSVFVVLPADLNIRPIRSDLQGVSATNYNPMRSFSFTGTYLRELSKK